MPARRPNLLLVMFDQMAPQSLGVYGHPLVRTPHLEALAERGVVFDRAYCNSPLCAPSRFSMMAGQLPSRIGAYDNAAEFASDVPTFAHYLRRLGYRTALAGKMHFVGPDQLHGYEDRLTTDVYPADFGWTADWLHPEQAQFWFHNMQSVVEAGVYARTLNLDYDEEVAYQATRHLYDIARDADERPFFLTVSFIQPHDPYMAPQPYWDLYDHEQIDMPSVAPIPLERRDPHSQRLYHTCQMDQYRIGDDHVRNARHAYYAMMAYVDDQLGALLRALESTGLRDGTVVFATSDHGDMLGERGMWYKMSFFERSVRVPLLVQGPGVGEGVRVGDSVSLLDLLPTFVELAGDGATMDYAAPIDGASLLPQLGGATGAEPRTVPAEYLAEGTTEPVFMLQRGRHKYVSCKADPAQLFDLESDPHELENRSGQPELAEVEAAFAAEAIERWRGDEIRARVVASQRRRLFLYRALQQGQHRGWDYEPRRDATRQYNRNLANELYDTDRNARIPRRDPPPFDSDSEPDPGGQIPGSQ